MNNRLLRKISLFAVPVALIAGIAGASIAQPGPDLSPKKCYKLVLTPVGIQNLEWALKPICEDDLNDWELIEKGCATPTGLPICEVPTWVEVKCDGAKK